MLTPLDAREQAFDEEKQWRSSDTRCLRRTRSSVVFSILMLLLDVVATAGNARLGLNRPVVLSIGLRVCSACLATASIGSRSLALSVATIVSFSES